MLRTSSQVPLLIFLFLSFFEPLSISLSLMRFFLLFNSLLGELSPEEQEEKETLLQRGFLNWSRREFHGFLRGCFGGRGESYDNIAKEIGTKDVKDVKAYAQAFWKKHKDIHGE